MKDKLHQAIHYFFSESYGQEIPENLIQVATPPKEQPFDFAIILFPVSKFLKRSPETIGNDLSEYLKKNFPEIQNIEIVKGYLNVNLSDEYWLQQLEDHQANAGAISLSQKVMVEYAGPNTNKPLHLGHLRNVFIGYSVAQILKAAGHEVMKVNIYNDRGVHICKSMLAYQLYGDHETPESSGVKGDHLVGEYYVRYDLELKKQVDDLVTSGMNPEEAKKKAPLAQDVQEMLRKWENGDQEVRDLWTLMNGWVYQGFEKTYREIGVDFDKYYYESENYLLGKEIVEEGLEKKVCFKKADGSVWIDLTEDGLDQKVLIRADGTSVYITQDLGTIATRYKDFPFQQLIYTVANEQDYHFKVLKLICKKLGKPYADGIYHLSYGMVDLPSGRMKSREGTVVDADDIIEEMKQTAERYSKDSGKLDQFSNEELQNLYRILGLGALKFFILKVDPRKRMVFNPEESIDFHGTTGPFIQYTHARIKSVLRKAEERNLAFQHTTIETLQPVEKALIKELNQYPTVISEAAFALSPAILANYLYQVAKTFNQFYTEFSILNAEKEEERNFRLLLSKATADVIKKGMKLLGIEVPERM